MGTKQTRQKSSTPQIQSIGALLYLERCHRNQAEFNQKAIDALAAAGRRARAGRKLWDFIGGAR